MAESIVSLKEIANILNGYAFKSSEYQNKGHRVIRITNVQKGFLIDDDPKFHNSSENLKKYELKENDILISLTGNVGRVGLVTKNILPAYLNQRVGCIRIKEDLVDNNFLFHFLNNDCFENDCINNSKGIAQLNLSTEWLKNVEIKLPSLEDQKKIAKILDKADEIRTKKKQSNEKLDEFLNSKFFEIFGNLETNTNGWKVEKLEDISYKITDGVHSKPVYTDSGIPFVSVKDITTKKLLLNDCKFISNEAHIKYSKRCKPEYEDVLYTKVGATYGRACVVDTQEEFSLYVSVALIKPKKNIINPYFLKAVLNTDSIKKQADKRIKGIGVPDLHLIEIKNFIIPVPPMVEQMKFLKIVEKVEEQKQRNEKIIEQMDNLFNSLSQKAFKGEL